MKPCSLIKLILVWILILQFFLPTSLFAKSDAEILDDLNKVREEIYKKINEQEASRHDPTTLDKDIEEYYAISQSHEPNAAEVANALIKKIVNNLVLLSPEQFNEHLIRESERYIVDSNFQIRTAIENLFNALQSNPILSGELTRYRSESSFSDALWNDKTSLIVMLAGVYLGPYLLGKVFKYTFKTIAWPYNKLRGRPANTEKFIKNIIEKNPQLNFETIKEIPKYEHSTWQKTKIFARNHGAAIGYTAFSLGLLAYQVYRSKKFNPKEVLYAARTRFLYNLSEKISDKLQETTQIKQLMQKNNISSAEIKERTRAAFVEYQELSSDYNELLEKAPDFGAGGGSIAVHAKDDNPTDPFSQHVSYQTIALELADSLQNLWEVSMVLGGDTFESFQTLFADKLSDSTQKAIMELFLIEKMSPSDILNQIIQPTE